VENPGRIGHDPQKKARNSYQTGGGFKGDSGGGVR